MISVQVTWGLPRFATGLRQWFIGGHAMRRTDVAGDRVTSQCKVSVTVLGLEVELHGVWLGSL